MATIWRPTPPPPPPPEQCNVECSDIKETGYIGWGKLSLILWPHFNISHLQPHWTMWWLHRLLALQILLNALLSNPVHMERTWFRMSYRMCNRHVLQGLSICYNLETTPASTPATKAMPDTLWWLWATQPTKEGWFTLKLSLNNVLTYKLSLSNEVKWFDETYHSVF